jgi:hypothetical protein
MKIFVQARKDGYNILFPTPTPREFYQFASDIQTENAKNNEIYYGKSFYSLAFTSGGCIFTKYVIGYDVKRNYMGNVGISFFIPNTQRLSGNDVKILLDELLNTYIRNYCPGNNISNKQEDWFLFTSLADSYDVKLVPHSNNFDTVTEGTQDPAFHYYKSDSELIEHFDKPFQEEYSEFKQIFFVDITLKGASNPLNVLRNSSIEVNPDLKNEFYYLNNYNSSSGVKISAYYNNKWNECSDKKGENQIRAKWPVEIKYIKEYYKPIKEIGSITNPISEIRKFLEINGNNIRIKYEIFLPEPESKKFTFDVVTKEDGVTVTDAEIQIDTQPWQSISNITFTAEELGREHKIVARRGDTQFSDFVTITPKYYSKDSIPLPLIEKRIVKITATDQENGDAIWQFKVHITDKDFNNNTDQIEFVGDEINKEWNIQIKNYPEYDDSEYKKFCPKKDGNEIIFELRKNTRQPSEPNNKVVSQHNPNDKEKKQKSFTAKANAFISKPSVFVPLIVVELLLLFCIWEFWVRETHTPLKMLDKFEIERYVDGNSLLPDSLKYFKDNWKLQEQNFIKNSDGGFFGGDGNVDSTKWEIDWKPAYEKIEQAIRKRKMIDNKNFAELKKPHYFTVPNSFRTAIENIDSTKYAEVAEKLGNVSTHTLPQIADSINAIIKFKEKEEQNKHEQSQEQNKGEKKTAQRKGTPIKAEYPKEKRIPQDHKTAKLSQKDIDLANINTEIEKYIKGSELEEKQLENFKNKNGIDQDLKDCIILCLKLWSLKGDNKNSFYWMQQQINNESKYSKLKESALKTFVDKMCDNNTPKYWYQIQGNKTLDKTLININLKQ